ncbi:MAG TPA: hypothetical protein VGS96_21380 [Thermoanaerobaculia bacterium]|nr:hypothetical protein [Thermoanaerobaculia bacterium]
MKVLAASLASLALACATTHPAPPSGRTALVLSKGMLHGSEIDALVLNQIQGQIHATTVLDWRDDIDENAFDTVVVLKTCYIGLRERSYDVASDAPIFNELMPVSYEVRRGGTVAHRGSFTLVIPDYRSNFAHPYLQGVPKLLRDIAQ